jgi:transposase
MGNSAKYSQEMRERAVRMLRDREHEYPTRWAAVESIAGKIGCTAQTLVNWIPKTEPVSITAVTERARLKQLERENAKLRRSNEILRKASAYFAQAELVCAQLPITPSTYYEHRAASSSTGWRARQKSGSGSFSKTENSETKTIPVAQYD